MTQRPIDITWRNLVPSEALVATVHDGVDRLSEVSEHLQRCRVVVELPHRRQRQGRLFHVVVELVVPGQVLVVRRDPSEHHAHEDPQVAIHDAFGAARRRLLDWEHKRQGRAARHEQARRRPAHQGV